MSTVDPALFLADLEAKPASLRTLPAHNPWDFVGPVRRVIFLGMGSSRYAAQVAARRLRAAGLDATAEYASAEHASAGHASAGHASAEHASAGHASAGHASAGHASAGQASAGGIFVHGDDTLVVAISATGASRETLDAVAHQPNFVALTNDPTSPLAGPAARVVEMHAGVERGGVACRSFQHTQILLDALVAHLTGQDRVSIERVAEATEDLLTRRSQWLPQARELLAGDGVFPIAPVERLSSALQSALMFREGPRVPADGCETGDWSHVDVYLTKTLRYRALLFPGSRYDDQALEWLHSRGSTVVAVGGEVPGAAQVIRFRHDDDFRVRLHTETLVAELVAAAWWAGH